MNYDEKFCKVSSKFTKLLMKTLSSSSFLVLNCYSSASEVLAEGLSMVERLEAGEADALETSAGAYGSALLATLPRVGSHHRSSL